QLDALLDDVLHVAEDVRPHVCALEHLAPLFVDDLALLVHHVVVLDDVLAGVEVHALDLLLCAGDRARDPRVLDRLDLEAVHQPADAVRGGPEDLHQVVLERDEELARARVALAAGAAAELVVDAPRLVAFGADEVQAADVSDARAEHDVGAAAGHVGRDRHGGGLPRLGDDRGLPLVLLGVQHVVADAALLEHARQALRLLDRHGADQHRSPLLVHLDDLVDDGLELRLLGLVDHVGLVVADHRAVRRDHDHVEAVDLVELLGLGQRGTGHARELVVLPEVVLDRDGRDRLLLLLDLHALLRLDGLVQAVRPAASGHGPAGELVDDDDLAILDDVVAIAEEQRLRLERLVDLVRLDDVLEVVDVADAGPALHLRDALLGQGRGFVLEVELVVLALVQARGPARELVVLLGRLLGLARDDVRRARLVDEDGVDLVDDRVGQRALAALGEVESHVVAQVVEGELRVGRVRDVGLVRLALAHGAQVLEARIGVCLVDVLGVVQVRGRVAHVHADAEPEQVVDGPHPARVTAGQVVVDRDEVRALPRQCVQVQREARDQRLALTGLHLGDLSVVEDDAADELDVEVAKPDRAARSLAADRESLDQQLVDVVPVLGLLAKLV